MDQIIVLDGSVVYLITDDGVAKWEFENESEAKELYELLIMSCEIELKIDTIVRNSI